MGLGVGRDRVRFFKAFKEKTVLIWNNQDYKIKACGIHILGIPQMSDRIIVNHYPVLLGTSFVTCRNNRISTVICRNNRMLLLFWDKEKWGTESKTPSI